MVLRDRSLVPGNEWRAIVPDTDTVFTAPSRHQLIPKVAAHLRGNGLPPMIDPDVEIEHYICSSMGEEERARRCLFCPEFGTPAPVPVATGLADVVGFLDFALKNGFAQVSQEEAERRARICAMCPLNVPVSGCTICDIARTMVDKASALLAGRTTEVDSKLQACAACGCQLKTKVHLDIKVPYRGDNFPSYCWQKEPKDQTL